MTLADLQKALTDLSSEMLEAATTLEQQNALLESHVKDWQQALQDIRDAIGNADEPM